MDQVQNQLAVFGSQVGQIEKPSDIAAAILNEGKSFIPGLRLSSKFYKAKKDDNGNVIQEEVQPGDWFIMEKNCGQNIKVKIGPWRMAARLFEGDSLLKSSLNGYPGNTYDAATNNWIIKGMAPVFKEILEKHLPDDKAKQRNNRVGIDVLLYLPDFQMWGVYFISGSAKKQTDIAQQMMASPNRIAVLGNKDGAGSFDYQIPTIRFVANEEINWPSDAVEQFNLFLNIPEESAEAAPARER